MSRSAKALAVAALLCVSAFVSAQGRASYPGVGGTSADDIKTGHVASLKRTDYPARTTLMKVSTVSTLWDYINRAMPWTQPKSLKPDEVYAVTAYLLSHADNVPADFTQSDKNIADVQERMPNRNGITTDHAMWPGPGITDRRKVDVTGTACMKDCAVDAKVTSMLPSFARNAHGNLAEQNRKVGAQHGIETGNTSQAPAQTKVVATAVSADAAAAQAVTRQNNCSGCHAIDNRIVGPSWSEIAAKHAGKADYLAAKIKSGGSGTWGSIPMPPQQIPDADARKIAEWLAAGAPK